MNIIEERKKIQESFTAPSKEELDEAYKVVARAACNKALSEATEVQNALDAYGTVVPSFMQLAQCYFDDVIAVDMADNIEPRILDEVKTLRNSAREAYGVNAVICIE